MAYNQTQKVVEDGNSFGNDPGDDPENKGDTDPRPNGNEASLVHATGVAPQTDIDVFGGDVGVDDTSNDNLQPSTLALCKINSLWSTYSRNGNSVGNFAHSVGRGTESWRRDTRATVVVNNDGSNEV